MYGRPHAVADLLGVPVGVDGAEQTRLSRALEARAKEIEARLTASPSAEEGLRLVVALIASVTNTAGPSAESLAAVQPDVADGIFGDSTASRLLGDTLAACYSGSDGGEQHWVRVSRGTRPWERPAEGQFRTPDLALSIPPTVKPFDDGLYTSTPLAAGYGMWRMYLDQYYGSDLFPLPWYTWRLTVPATARVVTVDNARGWARLVASFPRVHDGWVYPNWAGIAARYDGVRLTFPAVVATQGVRFLTPQGPTAPGFWDVESTYWLRWRLTDVALVTKTA